MTQIGHVGVRTALIGNITRLLVVVVFVRDSPVKDMYTVTVAYLECAKGGGPGGSPRS